MAAAGVLAVALGCAFCGFVVVDASLVVVAATRAVFCLSRRMLLCSALVSLYKVIVCGLVSRSRGFGCWCALATSCCCSCVVCNCLSRVNCCVCICLCCLSYSCFVCFCCV